MEFLSKELVTKMVLELLKKIQEFEDVPEEQLLWLIEKSQYRELKKGEMLFVKGDPIDKLHIILSGDLEIKVEQNGAYKTAAEIRGNGLTGLLPFSRATITRGNGLVAADMKLLCLQREYFPLLCANCYELTNGLVNAMTTRTREFTRNSVQEEKMMALGKLSAGLAHELNNPASAIVRSAKELKKHLANVPEKFKQVISIKASDDEIDRINEFVFSRINNQNPSNLSLIERSEVEEELEEWLYEHNLPNAIELCETLIDFDIRVEDLEQLWSQTKPENFIAGINWIENVLTTEKMVAEIGEASNRIADLVLSVKSYTHMDNSPEKKFADIHIGINNTLAILNHKLKQKSIEVDKQFAVNLPEVFIMVNELNQVWTNLIDNAIDALPKQGKLIIQSKIEGSFVKVSITDNGSGISEEHINQIFDQFFTTKPIGEGTGMGLDVVHRIIKQHNGEIKVTSKPGETVFTVCLPIN